MRRGGRGGKWTAAAAAAEVGAAPAAIPAAARKLVQSLKGIVAECPEEEIYAMLSECGMDPDVAVERLLSQDTFHEVRRKRDKKKEIKGTQESKLRAVINTSYRGTRGGSDRNGRFYQSSLGDPVTQVKTRTKKENGPNFLLNSSNLGSGKVASDTTGRTEVASNFASDKTIIPSTGHADGKPTPSQPPPQVQHGWVGMPGRPSMADIVKMGRARAKLPSKPVASGASYIAGSTFISNGPNHSSKEPSCTVLPPEPNNGLSASHDLVWQVTDTCHGNDIAEIHAVSKDDWSLAHEWPAGRGSQVPESSGAPAKCTDPSGSSTLLVDNSSMKTDPHLEETMEMDGSVDVKGLTSPGRPVSDSDREIQSEYSQNASQPNDSLLEIADNYQSHGHSFEHHQVVESNEELSSTVTNFEQLSLHMEEEVRPRSAENNPAVIIPNHLQVSDAECAHLTFGSFVSGALAGSFPLKPLDSSLEVAAVSDNSSVEQSDDRNQEYQNNEPLEAAPNEYVVSTTSTSVENLDVPSVSQPELRRSDLLDASNEVQYNLPSVSGYASSSATPPDSVTHTYLEGNRQLQNISPFSGLMQANTFPNSLLPATISPVHDLDQSFSQLLTAQSLPATYSTTSSSIGGTAVSIQENVKPGGFSNPQSTQSLPGTSIPSGPPLPQHLTLHPYSQPTLPLGHFASMIGYPSLAQSYPYLPPAAFQQPYMSNGLFHQSATTLPNSGIKYPLPQYKTIASLPQPASMLASYVGGFGAASGMPGSFALNPSTAASVPTTLGFDGASGSQYKDGNHFISLQQSENPAMWIHGAGSRGMPPLPAGAFYGYQGQSQQQHSGFRPGQQPSQFGAAVGHSGAHHSQAGLGQEHRNPSDGNSSAASRPSNQLWPNNY